MTSYEDIEHLIAWVRIHVADTEQYRVFDAILALLKEYPDLVKTHSWPEMRALAER